MSRIILMVLAILADDVLKQPESPVSKKSPAQQEAPIQEAQPIKQSEPAAPKINPRPTLNHIAKIVSGYYGLTLEELRSDRKTKYLAAGRQVAMYLMRKLTPLSLAEIGFFLRRMDHSTVLHGINKISKLIETKPEFAAEVEAIKAEILA